MCDLRYLCLFAYVVSNTYYVVVLFCLSSPCVLCLVSMLPVSLDCPFLIVPSVFSFIDLL
jgi:hypothetical protein